MNYILQHTALGFCWWDIPALIILIAVIVYFIVKWKKAKDEQEALEDELSNLYAEDSTESGDHVTE